MHRIALAALLTMIGICPSSVVADKFGSGANSFTIDFVSIGNPANPADTTGNPNPVGAVPYAYRIGKYEITRNAISKANAQSAADGNPLGITQNNSASLNHPTTSITWNEAAHFVNWLNTTSGSIPAYKHVITPNGFVEFENWLPADIGYDASNPLRNKLAKYFLPSSNEWYKAAFYDPAQGTYYDYATGSNVAPSSVAMGTAPLTAIYNKSTFAEVDNAGGLSPYGTMAQNGNVWEWTESRPQFPVGNDFRIVRGGGFSTGSAMSLSSSSASTASPFQTVTDGGFRIAAKAIPEPSTSALFAIACAAIGFRRSCRFRADFGSSQVVTFLS